MEYIPYRITAGSHKIKIYQNEFHGLKTFTSLEDGKEFLRSEALEVVKYEESGKNAENCVYSTETVLNTIHSVKDGLFIEELEDGFALKDKKYESYISWTPTITEKDYYMLASLVRPVSCPPKRVEVENEGSSSGHNEVIAQLKATLEEGIQLKSTGLLENLVNPVVEEVTPENSEEVFIESYENTDTEYSFEDCLLELPLIPELPPLPKLVIPMDVQSIEPILIKASYAEDLDKAIQELDEDLFEIEEQQDLITRALEELHQNNTFAQYPYERIPSEEPESSKESESTESSEISEEPESSESTESSEESESSSSGESETSDENSDMDFWYESSEDDYRRYSV